MRDRSCLFIGAVIRSMPYTRCARGSCVCNIRQLVDVILIWLSLDIRAAANKMAGTSKSSRKMS